MAITSLPLRRVHNHLRGGLARFKLRAHFLDLRGLLFELGRENLHSLLLLSNRGLQVFDFLMLLEELVEQHGVDRVGADGNDFSFGIAHCQIGVYLGHILGDEPKHLYMGWINIAVVAEGDRFKSVKRFAGVAHWLDVVLMASRGSDEAKFTILIYFDEHARIQWRGADVADPGAAALVGTFGADGNTIIGGGEITASVSSDTGIVIAPDVEPGPVADRGIVVTAYVTKERTPTKAVVKQAGCLVEERLIAERVAAVAGGGVVKERLGTEGAISVAGGVVKERLPTDGSVLGGVVGKERLETNARVAGGRLVEIERLRTNSGIFAAG